MLKSVNFENIICNDSTENETEIINKIINPLKEKLKNNDLIFTGNNARNVEGQESYIEILNKELILNPLHPFLYINDNFKSMKKYIKNEWDWYLSEDLSIINHPSIGTNPTWIACATKNDKQEINSNYGWCVYSKDNYSQLENCFNVLKKDKTSRNALLMYTRPSIHKDMYRNGMHDMICTVFSQFFIRNNKLEMIHVMRSNDFKFGFLSDFPWSCLVYQDLYNNLKEIYPDLEVGNIHWTSTSMHLYSRHYDLIKNL